MFVQGKKVIPGALCWSSLLLEIAYNFVSLLGL